MIFVPSLTEIHELEIQTCYTLFKFTKMLLFKNIFSYITKNTSTCTTSAPVGHELNLFAL